MTNPSSDAMSWKNHNDPARIFDPPKASMGIFPRPGAAGMLPRKWSDVVADDEAWSQVDPDPWPIETRQSLSDGRMLPLNADMGLCDRVCPEHRRHCDAYGDGRLHNLGHEGPHACANCDDWEPRAGADCLPGRCPYGVCP